MDERAGKLPQRLNARIRRAALIVAAALAATLVIGAAWTVVSAVRISIAAEEALHAVDLAIQAVDEYVVTQGEWPRSWIALEENVVVGSDASTYQWPRDAAYVKRHVQIDFHAQPAEMRRRGREEFEPIRPIGPCYGYHGMLVRLYEHVCDLRDADESPP